MEDSLAALHDTAETEFATDLRTENTFPGVRSIISVPSAEPRSMINKNERFLTIAAYLVSQMLKR